MFTDAYDRQLVLRDGGVLRVRGLQPTDGSFLGQFLEGLSPASRRFWRPGHPYNLEGAVMVLEAAAGPREIHFLVLAEDGALTAYGLLQRLERAVPSLGIVVGDAWQDRGIGAALMRFLVDVARDMEKLGVDLTVNDDNPRAIHVYEGVGFQL